MAKVPKIKGLHIFKYLQKSVGHDDDFLHADKHESFLQVDSITYSVRNQAYPKYSKQQVDNVFTISQGKRDG